MFAGSEKQIMPTVLLGVRESENLYVTEAGMWNSKYIPAFARRYPFVFSSNDLGKTLTLCLDEEFSGFNQDGEGEQLFSSDGEQTPYLKRVLEFQQEFQKNFQRTQSFCERLQELGLLDPMEAKVKFDGEEKVAIAGFMVVNRDRLKSLSAEKLSELAKIDELELIYLHLQSMQNISSLAARIDQSSRSVTKDSNKMRMAEGSPSSTDNNESIASKKKTSAKKKKAAVRKKKSVTGKSDNEEVAIK